MIWGYPYFRKPPHHKWWTINLACYFIVLVCKPTFFLNYRKLKMKSGFTKGCCTLTSSFLNVKITRRAPTSRQTSTVWSPMILKKWWHIVSPCFPHSLEYPILGHTCLYMNMTMQHYPFSKPKQRFWNWLEIIQIKSLWMNYWMKWTTGWNELLVNL